MDGDVRRDAAADAVPVETQFLLAMVEGVVRGGGSAAGWRVSLCAARFGGKQTLELIAESGDAATATDAVTALFVAAGSDPYALAESAAEAVMQRMQIGRLRKDKPLPAFVDDFGWCTFDAFYAEVTHEGIRQGLQSFRAAAFRRRCC